MPIFVQLNTDSPKGRKCPVGYLRAAAGECWEWSGPRSHGYGVLYRQRRNVPAHRFVFEQTNGPVPDGLDVCHHCDNPPCVNPAHLFVGTRKDNVQDMIKKGRRVQPQTQGEMNGRALLGAADVRCIRRSLANGILQRTLASLFGVSKSTIGLISNGTNWSHE